MLLSLFNLAMTRNMFLGLIGTEGKHFISAEILNIEKSLSPIMMIAFLALYIGIFLLIFALTETAKPIKNTIGL